MRLSNLFFQLSFIFLISSASAQVNTTKRNDYYMFPIKPGLRSTLSGTMGELRSSHFHSGIDIRTDGRTGLPVHAAAKGYISRVAVSTGGYGNAIYIQHPNGHTTVYAHLDKFLGPVADYVRKEQYRRKTFKINLYFRAGQFPVAQGDTVALSGNSGSSGGPHVHFDIRDKNQKPLNPLSYGFDEIVDTTTPLVKKVAIKTLNSTSRVNGQFGRKEFEVRRIGKNFIIDKPIEASGLIGIELYAYDQLDNTRFRCGINSISMKIDSKPFFDQKIKTFAFSEQKNLLAHLNYRDMLSSGERFHKLYIDDGNFLKFYTTDERKGKLYIHKNDPVRNVSITMKDSYGNENMLTFKLKSDSGKSTITDGKESMLSILDNTLKVKTPFSDTVNVSIDTKSGSHKLDCKYSSSSNNYFLYDMRKDYPVSVNVNGDSYKTLIKDVVPSTLSYTHYGDRSDAFFPKYALFDTLYLETDYELDTTTNREVFTIGNNITPMRKNATITLKPNREYNSKHTVFSLAADGGIGYAGGTWKNGLISFKTRKLGKFVIAADTIPPTIKPLVVNSSQVKFKIEDNMTGIKSFKCYINGDWVLMNYDYKRNLIWSEKLDKNKPFVGTVKLIVDDNVNNQNQYENQIK